MSKKLVLNAVKLLITAIVSFAFVVSGSSIAQAAPALPTTTTWVDSGQQEMVRLSGQFSVSINAFANDVGNMGVYKPTGSTTVIAAYLTTATTAFGGASPSVDLNGTRVTFSHSATETTSDCDAGAPVVSCGFKNYFADVTNIVKPTLDAAQTANVNLFVVENDSQIQGEELVVIYENSTQALSSVMIFFGTAAASGDTFTANFPALTDLSSQIVSAGVGIGFSNSNGSPWTQHSEISIATSLNSTPQLISETAGGFDDGVLSNSKLLTVGGTRYDSRGLPGTGVSKTNDDEYYGLNSFLGVGDTSISFTTINPTRDDNLFQTVLLFEGVSISGASLVGSAAQTAQSPSSGNAQATAATEAALAKTGVDTQTSLITLSAGIMLLLLGAALIWVRRVSR